MSDLYQEFQHQVAALSNDPAITIRLSSAITYCAITQLQLAYRHPENTPQGRQQAEQLARMLQSALCSPDSALGIVLEQVWTEMTDIAAAEEGV